MRRFLIFLGMFAVCGILGPGSFGGSETTRSTSATRSRTGNGSAGKVPTFTLDQAIFMSLQQNPTLLNAEQEIKRTKGVIIQVRAQALPQISATANFDWTDPNLVNARTISTSAENTNPVIPGTGASSLIESPASQVNVPRSAAGADAAPTATPGARNTSLSDVSYSISVTGT